MMLVPSPAPTYPVAPVRRLHNARPEVCNFQSTWRDAQRSAAQPCLWLLSGSCLLGFARRAVRGGAASNGPKRCGVRTSRVARAAGAVEEGDTIAVVGAGGNVGRLVAQRLCSMNMFQVHGAEVKNSRGLFTPEVLRNRENAKWAEGMSGLTLFEADSRDALALQEPLSTANAVVCTTGVPAFGIAGQWEKGNHPESVDHFGVKNAAHVWSAASGPKRRFVLMSSIGVTRRDGFPYSILNGGGVLDAKARGEAAVRELAKQRGFGVTVVRPGQLFGGPYDNNRYLGTLFQLDKDSSVGAVKLEAGDTAVGDTLRSSLAGVLVRSLFCAEPDMEFAVINEDGEPPSEEAIDDMLRTMSQGPTASEADEQMQKRLGLAGDTLGKAVENVVSGKLFDKS
ncbi:TIC62 [Symbiodinium natans]|uniref:TIC62 protein n=1 Tax=Symbiodinium natans TaxID=878477 RepID=A0A812U150_9DINO|nr:TIC62 [Symbiodinium natans]